MHKSIQNTHHLSNTSVNGKPASCFADTQFDMHDPYGVINSSGGVVIHLRNKLGNIFQPASRLKYGWGYEGREVVEEMKFIQLSIPKS